jgi:hypothetical protein
MSARQHAWRSDGTCGRCEMRSHWSGASSPCTAPTLTAEERERLREQWRSTPRDRDVRYRSRDAGYQRKLYWKKRQTPSYACGICHALGHNRQTCPQRAEAAS